MGEPSLAVALAKAWISQLYDAALSGGSTAPSPSSSGCVAASSCGDNSL